MRSKILRFLFKLFGVKMPILFRYKTVQAPSDNEIVAWLSLKHWDWVMEKAKNRAIKHMDAAVDDKSRSDAVLRLSGVLLVESLKNEIISEFHESKVFDPESFGMNDETAVENFEKKHGHIVFH